MKTALFFMSLALVIFTQAGCQTKEEPVTREKALSEGFTLMDQGRYDEAITYFDDMLAHDQHYHVKMALASAYAGRAGVKIEQIYSFAVVKEVAIPKIEIQGLTLDKKSTELMKSLAKYVEQWNKIPDVKNKARTDVQSALKVLDEETEPGARLYAATLRIVNLKSSIIEGVENFTLRTQNAKKICTQDLKPYVAWSGKIFDVLKLLATDLEFAFPEQKKNYEDLREKIETTKTQVLSMTWPASNQCF
jgi:tetratricopeptide (TPR) repeat protein